MEGYEMWLNPARARLALVRADLDDLGEVIEGSDKWLWIIWSHVNNAVTRLDALVALGRLEEAEEQAIPLLRPGTYLEPFALRTLGFVRRDADLIAQAAERFGALGLSWHAAQTRDQLRSARCDGR
jgi:hypothetical protein